MAQVEDPKLNQRAVKTEARSSSTAAVQILGAPREKERTEVPVRGRLASLDALRGFDMFWITGGEELVHSLFRVFPHPWTEALDRQFQHVPWAGFHFYDLIFPLFLFIVGAVMPFSLTRRLEAGASRAGLYRHIVRRFLLLFLLGLVYNGLLDFRLHDLRIAGVLQRIAVSYFLAALVVMNTSPRGQATVTGGILLLYWAIMKLIPVPGFGAGVLTPQGNLSAYLDQRFLPRPYCCYVFGDNEGIISTIPAISTTLLGVLAGHWLRSTQAPKRKLAGLLAAGLASLLVGLVWGHWFPVIKNLWTSSYVLVAAGWSLLLLAFFYWIIDLRGLKRWAFFFVVIGLNPITIYVARRLFDFEAVAAVFVHGFIDYFGPLKPLFWDFSVLAVGWLFLWFLYRQKIFLKV
jgi:predicted acyltransferase